MTERPSLTDEQLRGMAVFGIGDVSQRKMAANELLTLRTERARLEARLLPFANAVDDTGKLKGGTLSISYRDDFIAARQLLLSLSQPAESRTTEKLKLDLTCRSDYAPQKYRSTAVMDYTKAAVVMALAIAIGFSSCWLFIGWMTK